MMLTLMPLRGTKQVGAVCWVAQECPAIRHTLDAWPSKQQRPQRNLEEIAMDRRLEERTGRRIWSGRNFPSLDNAHASTNRCIVQTVHSRGWWKTPRL